MSLASLDVEHLASFKQAMTNLLSIPAVEFTYAQIVDGMPTSDTYTSDHWFYEGFPVLNHQELCPGTVEKTRALRSQFDILCLEFEPKTIPAYQDTCLGSVAYKLRLLELVVIACHDIAVSLYQVDDGAHKHAEWETWLTEKRASLSGKEHRFERFRYPPPTPFYANAYAESDRYPNGVADVVGYWAEHHIFGGVVLFDRGESEEECNEIYIHNPQRSSTIAPPTEKQFHNPVNFLLSPNPDTDPNRCPLPIHITEENKWRWHRYDGMVDYHIFKFRHEIPRKRYRDHCVISIRDWPEWRDQDIIEEAMIQAIEGEAYDGEVYDEALVAAARENLRRTATPTSRCYAWDDEETSTLQPDPKRRGRPPYYSDP